MTAQQPAEPIRVLLVEDSEDDYLLLKNSLAHDPDQSFALERVDRLAAGIERLGKGGIDAVLLDLSLPDSKGVDGVYKLRQAAPETPIVVMTGLEGIDTAAAALKTGAQDYLIKRRTDADSLVRSLRYAIARKSYERQKERFLHDVNHELRTPLAAIIGGLGALEEELKGSTNRTQEMLLQVAATGAVHLMNIVASLEDMIRSDTGKLEIKPEDVAPGPIIGETVALIGLSEKARALTFSSEVPEKLPLVRADPVRLRQILLNLLGNSVKFTPRGGGVAVRAGLWEEDEDFLRVSVADTGVGIEAKTSARIFERHFQAGGDRGAGLGIGLYLCKDLVTRQGGKIWVESEPGKGSAFSFILPVAR